MGRPEHPRDRVDGRRITPGIFLDSGMRVAPPRADPAAFRDPPGPPERRGRSEVTAQHYWTVLVCDKKNTPIGYRRKTCLYMYTVPNLRS